MKIAIASLGDPSSVGTWSGIPANIIASLKKNGHVIHPISLTRPEEPWHYNWLRRFYWRTQNKWFLSAVEVRSLKAVSSQLDQAVNALKPEVVLVIHGDWLAYSTFQYPACIIHDTTFASIVDYYPSFSNLATRSLRLGNEMYQKSLDRAKAAVYSAEWASQSAINDYRIAASKVFTIPFGANLYESPTQREVGEWIAARERSESCNFVFIGTQWKRKGGPEVLRFIEALHRLGIQSRLTIVGCSPDIPFELKDFVDLTGYLKKDNPSEGRKLKEILIGSHALILPSEAECYGCVYCEANAYGLPALGRDTGGVPEIIKDSVNGILLGSDELPESFAARWASIWQDRSAYRALCHSAYSEFKKRLNYDVFADKLQQVLANLVRNNN
jgi:glycosyltransferase involved in cell wall biosynthesis